MAFLCVLASILMNNFPVNWNFDWKSQWEYLNCPVPEPCPILESNPGFLLYNRTDFRTNEGLFTGQINSSGERHGDGRLVYLNGDIYEGRWENDLKSGFGELKLTDGSVFRGYWQGNQLVHGDVKSVYRFRYTGDMRNGKFSGVGRLKNEQGREYVGEFLLGLEDGFGCERVDGSLYAGLWSQGLKSGTGLQSTPDSIYYGDFLQGRRHGQGVVTWPEEGAVYQGSFRLGEKEDNGRDAEGLGRGRKERGEGRHHHRHPPPWHH